MSATSFFFCLFALWVVIGVVSALVMGRRGHDPFPWLLMGGLLGPIVIPVALARTRHEQPAADLHADTNHRRGPVDALVGIDGSPESLAAANVVVALLDGRLGRLTLATVITYEAGDPAHSDERGAAENELARAAANVGSQVTCGIDTRVLVGRPDLALIAHATDDDFDILAIGSRGRGVSKLLMGSVARHVSENARIPVLIANSRANR